MGHWEVLLLVLFQGLSYLIFLPTFEEDLAPQAICFVQLLGGRE